LAAPRDLGKKTRGKRPTAPLLVAPPQVRAPSIEGPALPAALCEATASSARSPMSLGAITAHLGAITARPSPEALRGQCWPASLAVGGSLAPLAGARSTQTQPPSHTARSGRCPERSQRAAPTRSRFLCPTGRRAVQHAPPPGPAQPRRSGHPTAPAAPPQGRFNHVSDDGGFIIQATAVTVGQETKLIANCAHLHQLCGTAAAAAGKP
jgi:hypothetical protein